MESMQSNRGQVIIILILIMTVALAIGLSIIQKSLTDVSTSTKVEQSARAFSAAEAGIEKALQADSAIGRIDVGDNATLQGVQRDAVPAQDQALEYPPIAKEELAHVWLAEPDTLANYYKQTSLDIYWGGTVVSGREQPALEVKIVYQDSAGYQSLPFYVDPVSGVDGQLSNGFKDPSFYQGGCGGYQITTSLSSTGATNDRSFKCKISLSGLPNSISGLPKLVLVRARFLYNSTSQPFAVQPKGSCTSSDTSCSLPVQARLFTSIGISGETQRSVQVFRLEKVVPPYFDYAIFSAGEIKK